MKTEIDYGFLSTFIVAFVITLAIQEMYNYWLGLALMLLVSMQIFHEISHLIMARVMGYKINYLVISRHGSHTDFDEPDSPKAWRDWGIIGLAGAYFDLVIVGAVLYCLTNAGDLLFAYFGYLLLAIYVIMEMAYPKSDFRNAMIFFENGKKMKDNPGAVIVADTI
jgi:hypothetical protein